MLYKHSKIAIIGCLTALLLAPLGVNVAQGQEQNENPPMIVSLANQYIEFNLGIAGTVRRGDTTYDVSGRYGVVNRTGDPEVAGDDNQELTYYGWIPHGLDNANYAIWKMKVGNAPPIRIGGAGGEWTRIPRKYEPPTPGLGLGRTGPYIEGEWTSDPDAANGIAAITFKVRISLVRDQVRFEFNVTNNGATLQNVGVAMFADAIVGVDDAVGYPFIPGTGLARLRGFPDQFFGTVLSGTQVPSYFEYYNSVDDPVVVARNTLRGHDCVPPDYVAIGQWQILAMTNTWLPESYQPELQSPRTPITDMAWLLQWKQAALRPRATRNIVTYFGVGAASSAWTHRLGSRVNQDSAMLAVQAPRALRYNSTGFGSTQLSPETFQVKAYVYNLATDPGPYNLEDMSMYLHLPKGLQLAPGSSAQQELDPVLRNSESAPVVWDVVATGEYSGELEYFVSVKDISGWQQVVSRKIIVPATKKTVLRGGGYQMMSVPFTGNNPSVEHLMGWGSGSYFAKSYDPSGVGSYKTLTTVEPGKAFWVSMVGTAFGSTIPVTLAPDAMIAGEVNTQQIGEVPVSLGQGWNMVGNPFVYPVYLGQLMVYNRTTNTSITFSDAVAQNWISRTVFGWNASKQAYEYLSGNDSYLMPWQGYWVRARVPVILYFRPAIWPSSGVTTLPGGY